MSNQEEVYIVLEKASSADAGIRTQAEATLNQAIDAQFGPFLCSLGNLSV
jgi:hypothetical protein